MPGCLIYFCIKKLNINTSMANLDKVSISVKAEQKYFWLKLIGMALVLHIALIAISILEVTIYSYLIDPGKDQAFYSAHAEITGPWISGIFGSLFMFLLVKRYIKKFNTNILLYAIALPVIYMLIDQLILVAAGADIMGHLMIFVIANGVKVIGSLAAYIIYKPKDDISFT